MFGDAEEKGPADLSLNKLYPVQWGLIYQVVCAPSSWGPRKVARVATEISPPGTSLNMWVISDPSERQDEWSNVNQKPCPDCVTRTHWLINC